ncbi:hypothetical protein BAE44_0001292 [Dichanthelium oligosanthes]|uniref:MATH domain-containing protein n=1 Tax=Dichanthelium oligosanthes TaxID=888268 RepID=A0A1E5WJX8_9POAL|nr:hypothetical protein BAE44_0001292 [Dichanthelium oligosanthes]
MASSSSVGDPSATISVRAYHVLQIDGYSTTSDALGNFQCITSLPFHEGSYTWFICFYPRGTGPEDTDFISLFLVLADTVDEVVTAQATISLLNQDRNSVLSYSHTTSMVDFSELGPSCGVGYNKFIKREDFEQSKFLKNDCFAIRVDIHIVKEVPYIIHDGSTIRYAPASP